MATITAKVFIIFYAARSPVKRNSRISYFDMIVQNQISSSYLALLVNAQDKN